MLHVALQEGFSDDTVMIQLNDEPIFERSDVKTDVRIGRADAIDVQLREGRNRLRVTLPERNISGSVIVQSQTAIYVGVSVDQASVEFTVSDEPFGYM